MVEGVHFSSGHVEWTDLGWKAMAASQSDIAAMGCIPLYAVVTLGLRGDLPVDGVLEMYDGMLDACERSGGAIVGGDIVRSSELFVTVALEGTSGADGKILTRDSASPGQAIAVTGSLGCSGGGLRLRSEIGAHDPATASHLEDAHSRPSPRVEQGLALVQSGVLAAIDISDGLVDDLSKLCEASGVEAIVHADRVPADDFLRKAYPDDWLELALGGGEDYELLFTGPQRLMRAIEDRLDVPVSVIGEMVDGPAEVSVLDKDGNVLSVRRTGWDHFKLTRT
jgi:thiamine-monophosphate kinase